MKTSRIAHPSTPGHAPTDPKANEPLNRHIGQPCAELVRGQHSRVAACLASLAWAATFVCFAGCTLPYRTIALDASRPAHARPFNQQREGVVLAADLVDAGAETQALFGRALYNRAVVPVVVHIENLGDRTFVLRRDRITLRLEGVENGLVPLDPELVIAWHRHADAWAYLGAPLIFPYLVERQAIARHNFELDRDYRAKSLPGYLRMAPGDAPKSHVLFFGVERDRFDKLRRSPVLEVPTEVEATNGGGGRSEQSKPGLNEKFLLSLG